MRAASSHQSFPDGAVLAQAFFVEGIRHLEDAQVLHQAARYPGAIASALKAAELGVKSVIVLGGAMGWWDKVFTTHSPLSEINNLPIFEHHVVTLGGYRPTLIADVTKMEGLSPTKPGGSYDISLQQNSEYPFLSYRRASAGNPGQFYLNTPSTHFVEADSKKYYNTAQDLLTAVATQYATIGGWGLLIPSPL